MSSLDSTFPRDRGAPRLATDAVARLLEASGRQVAAELEAMPTELAHWAPGPGEWCATEIVGHLVESDRRGFTGRIRRMLAEERPFEASWDQAAVAAGRRDRERAVAHVLSEFLELRADGVALVRSLGRTDLARTAVHEAVGEITVGEILQEWIYHDRNHVRQLLTIVQARAWPWMGATRRFTRPES